MVRFVLTFSHLNYGIANNTLFNPTEAQKKKHLTAEEHAMRRAEMARRRKNLSEKRNEEEKVRYLLELHTQLLSKSLILTTTK